MDQVTNERPGGVIAGHGAEGRRRVPLPGRDHIFFNFSVLPVSRILIAAFPHRGRSQVMSIFQREPAACASVCDRYLKQDDHVQGLRSRNSLMTSHQ